MTNAEFLDTLAQRQLVPTAVVAKLRAKIDQDDARITPESILKYLVKKELITRPQAQQLLETRLRVNQRTESSILGMAALPEQKTSPRNQASDDPPPTVVSKNSPGSPPASSSPADSGPASPTTVPPAAPQPTPAAQNHDDLEMLPFDDEEHPGSAPAGGRKKPLDDDAPATLPAAAVPTAAAGNHTDRTQRRDTDNDVAGPIDGLLGGDSLADHGAESLAAAALEGTSTASRGSAKRRARKKKQSEWDSPLILLGGGGLIVLCGAGALIYYLLFRENADAILKEASAAFNSGSYTQAINHYEQFVANFPRHGEYSDAKVRLGMAKLWRAAEGSNAFPAALATAEEVIAAIEDEPAFAADENDPDGLSKAKRELSSLLTQIAKGLAGQAEAADDPATIEQRVAATERALALCGNTKYVPQRLRLDSELEIVRETLQRVASRRQRDADLATALAAMDAAIATQDTAAAYAAQKQLVDQHPGLRTNDALTAKLREVAVAEQANVRYVAAPLAAITTPDETPVAAVTLFRSQGEVAAGVEGVAVVRVDGALYGLRADSGKMLWRRPAGREASSFPLPLPNQTTVAVDTRTQELLCLETPTGILKWRLPIGQPLGQPVLVQNRLFVPTAAGRLYAVDPVRGDSPGYVQLTQPLDTPPGASPDGKLLYLVGQHSNLYTLSGTDLACRGVYYLGHAKGTIRVPPVAVLNKVICAENSGAQTSRLRVLALDTEGVVASEPATARVEGLIVTPLLTAGRRVAALSTLGAVSVSEVGAGEDNTAFTPVASRDALRGTQLARYGLLTSDENASHLWVAGAELLKLAVLPTGNRLPVRSLDRDYEGDAFDHPLLQFGRLVVHVRRPAGANGARAAAVDAKSNRTIWETDLAVPAAGAPAIDGDGASVSSASSAGAVFLADRESLSRAVLGSPQTTPLPADARPFTGSLDLGSGSLLLESIGSDLLILFRPQQGTERLETIRLPAPLSGQCVLWRDGFVAANSAGQVTYYDGATGSPVGSPFQPPLTPAADYRWVLGSSTEASTESSAGEPLIAADGRGRGKIYALAMAEQPRPHLQAVAVGELGESPLITPLAVVAGHVLGGNEAGEVISRSLADLKPVGRVELGARVTWGPFAAGPGVLVGLETGELVRLDSAAGTTWRVASPHGPPIGIPSLSADTALVLFQRGILAAIDLTTGDAASQVDVGERVSAGPVLLGRRAALNGADGTLLFVDLPQ